MASGARSERLGRLLQRAAAVGGALLRAALGELRWRPPPWYAAARGALATGRQLLRRQPRRSALCAGAALLALGATCGGWRWYQRLPRPVEYEVAVSTPARRCIECEPPGRPNPLVLHFSGSVAPLKAAGQVIEPRAAGIAIVPAVAGEWRWQDDATLLLTPSADWPVAQDYTVSFARRGFTAPQVRLEHYRISFRSPPFTAGIVANEFYQDPVLAADKKIVSTLAFSEPVDTATLAARVALRLYAKLDDSHEQELSPPPGYTLSYDKLRLHAYVHSSQLAVLPKGGRVVVSVDRGVRAARGGNASGAALTASVPVPGLYSLTVQDLTLAIARDERDTPSQALVIDTSHAVTEAEMSAHVRAWILPLRHPDGARREPSEPHQRARPYPWAASQVTPEVLAQAEPLALSYVSNEREHVELHSFRLQCEPGRQVYVRIDAGLRSFGGYLMARAVDRVLAVPDYPREVHIAYQGALLALSGPKKLVLETRAVAAVRVQVGRLLPDQLQHLVTQSGGDFAQPRFTSAAFDAANITERYEEIRPVAPLPAGAASYQSLDLAPYLGRPGAAGQGVFLLTVEAYDPVSARVLPARANEATEDTRLVVVTDLGLIAKRAVDGSQELFVQSIASGAPLPDTLLEVIGRNGAPLLSRRTDAAGHAHFPDLRSYRDEREPVLYLASAGADSSFLPIRSHVEALDLSRFDVGGLSNRAERAALSAYLFCDRGIYRPGDEIRAALIVKTQDWRALPPGLPLRVQITDPRGVAVKRELLHLGSAGFEELRYQTRASAPAGGYTLDVYLLKAGAHEDLLGSLTVRLQEFLPDRMRMSTHFSAEQSEGWVGPEQLQALVTLENLFGTPAAGRRVRASMRLTPADVTFERYHDYLFRDPQAARAGFAEDLSEQTTTEQGRAAFDLNLGRFARATYRVALVVQGYEADGGRAVSAEATQLVSSLPFLVGWKADGALDFIARGAARSVDLLAIDSRLAPTSPAGLRLERLERRYVSVLLRQDSGVYKYESRLQETSLQTSELSLSGGRATLKLDSATPGNFSYLVRGADGQSYARIDYTVAGAANLSRSLEKNAELQIVLDKHDYAPGESIALQIQAPYTGTGLITIERDRVYSWQWFHSATTSSVQTIRVPEDLEGNGYVSVSFVRDPSSPQIFSAPLSYGVQPFSIALDARRNAVTLRAPTLVRPGEELSIAYRTQQPARLALFAVDEGILQVAHYQTPDPLAYFFRKRALDVSTRQILDLILPGFRASMLSAPGGDQGALLGAHLNPFKRRTDPPVAWWAGIVDADGRERTAHWVVPDYFNGRLRIMAVAVNDDTVGVAEQAVLVRGDFVLTPNVPLTVTPGDEFEVSVGVANNLADAGSGVQVTVALSPSPHFEVLGPARLTLAIPALHESAARFRVRARDLPGAGSLEFSAAAAGHGARLVASVAVRPAAPYMTLLSAGSFTGALRVPVTRSLYPELRTLEASVSALPLAVAHGLSAYLDHYPYSCTEQLVSQAMPAVVLAQRPEFGVLRSRHGATLQNLIDELRARQQEDGSFRYWAGGVESIDFVSVYALHVLLEASERGAAVPADLLESGRAFLTRLARRDADNLDEERTGAYAIYLLARQGIVVANEAAALQSRLSGRYPQEGPADIASAYLAGAYQLMQQQSLAERTVARVRFGSRSVADRWHAPMSDDAVLLYLLARHFPQRLARLPDTVLETLVQRVQRGEYDSLSAADTILALDAYATASAALGAPHFAIEATLADRSSVSLPLPAGLFPKASLPPEARALEFSSDSPLRSYYLLNQSGFDRQPAAQPLAQGLEITRELLDAAGRPVQTVRLGDEVTVQLRFRALGRDSIDDAVLVDLLPGGFDLVVPGAEPADAPGAAAARRASGACRCTWLLSRPAAFPDFADLREDRVVLYGRALDRVQEFSYRIRATNAGSYLVPPAYGESMYDPKVHARSLAEHIRIERP